MCPNFKGSDIKNENHGSYEYNAVFAAMADKARNCAPDTLGQQQKRKGSTWP